LLPAKLAKVKGHEQQAWLWQQDREAKTPSKSVQMVTTQHGTAWHSTAQHSTAQHSTAQHSTAGALPDAVTGHAWYPCAYLVISFSFLLIFLLTIYLLTRRPTIQYLQCMHTSIQLDSISNYTNKTERVETASCNRDASNRQGPEQIGRGTKLQQWHKRKICSITGQPLLPAAIGHLAEPQGLKTHPFYTFSVLHWGKKCQCITVA